MPTLEKLLSKFDKRDREILEFLIGEIISLDWRGLNIRKLKVYKNVFRLRKSNFRIIFIKRDKVITLINIDRRNESTYKF
jgi:mRNA-degrading endonuclease RelE of RelBE toxin-antitoxin system